MPPVQSVLELPVRKLRPRAAKAAAAAAAAETTDAHEELETKENRRLRSPQSSSCCVGKTTPAKRDARPSAAAAATPSPRKVLAALSLTGATNSPRKVLAALSPTGATNSPLTRVKKSLAAVDLSDDQASAIVKKSLAGRGTSPVGRRSRTPVKSLAAAAAASPTKRAHTPSKTAAAADAEVSPGKKARTPVKALQQLQSPTKCSPRKPPCVGGSPRKRLLFRADVSRLAQARRALAASAPDAIFARQTQMDAIAQFLSSNVGRHAKDHKQSAASGGGSKKSLYISGAPGTGKTASLTYLLNQMTATFQTIFINCMSLKSSGTVYDKVAKELDPEFNCAGKREREVKKFIEDAITNAEEPILLVLDEIDQLDSKNQEILYTLFEWPLLAGSRLSLVGIANALDLTDRVLPRLKLREAVCPQQLSFPAYSRADIEQILLQRLKPFNDPPQIIKPIAIKFLSGKISSVSGDVRKALDVCRRALELAEIDARKQTVLAPLTAGGDGCARAAGPSGVKTVDLPQILKVLNEVYGSRVASSLQGAPGGGGGGLPLQQKLIVACLLLATTRGRKKCKEVALGKLLETYVKVCKKRKMSAVDEAECVSLCSLLESRGLITVARPKGSLASAASRNFKLSLRIDEKEVAAAMQDKTLLSDILNDVACIST